MIFQHGMAKEKVSRIKQNCIFMLVPMITVK
jgi:hypothetical protein